MLETTASRAPMRMMILFIALICTSVHHSFTLAQSSYPIIGSNDSTPAVAFNFEGFYLNTLRPAPSNGTITTIEYCYYGRRDNSVRTYQSLVAVYRRATRDTVNRVSDTIQITKRLPSDNVPPADVLLLGFNCDYLELKQNISVIAGDLIGACIYDDSDTETLNLVSVTDSGEFLPVDSANSADCNSGTLPRRIDEDHLEDTMRRVRLHLFAEIVPDDIAAMDININATIQPRPYTGEQYFEATEELPSAEGQTSALFVTIVVTIGGLVLVAVIVLIIVVIIIAYCLTQKLKCSDKNEYIAASPIRDIEVSMDINSDTRSNSEYSLHPSERQYDYIVNDMMLAERFRQDRLSQKSDSTVTSMELESNVNNDCAVQQNVAYTTNKRQPSQPKIVKSPYHDDYVVFVP